MSLASGPIVALDGWAAVSAKAGTLPDEVYVVSRAKDGSTSFFRARSTARRDVADYFKQPGLQNSGFEAYIDL